MLWLFGSKSASIHFQGGTKGDPAMTAFVLVSLLELRCDKSTMVIICLRGYCTFSFTAWLHGSIETLPNFAVILPSDFSEFFKLFQITAYFEFQLILGYEIIKFLIVNKKSEDSCFILYCGNL